MGRIMLGEEPIEYTIPKVRHEYPDFFTDDLDAPSETCSRQQLVTQALAAIEVDESLVLEAAINEGLAEVCCGEHSHGLLHEATRLRAWKCVNILLQKGWAVDRRIHFPAAWNSALDDDMRIRQVPTGLKFLWDASRNTPGGSSQDRVSPTALELHLAYDQRRNLWIFYKHGADRDGSVLETLVDGAHGGDASSVSSIGSRITNIALMLDDFPVGGVDGSLGEHMEKELALRRLQKYYLALRRHRFDLARTLMPLGLTEPWMRFSHSLPYDTDVATLSADAVAFLECDSADDGLPRNAIIKLVQAHHRGGVLWLLLHASRNIRFEPHTTTGRTHESWYLALLSLAVDNHCRFTRDLILHMRPDVPLNGCEGHAVLPLHRAAQSPYDDAGDDVAFLLAHGADPNIRVQWAFPSKTIPYPFHCRYGGSMLYGDPPVREFSFVVHGEDCALHIVARANTSVATRRARLDMLLTAGADPNAVNTAGNTPLHCHAARAGLSGEDWAPIRDLLVAYGADETIRNRAGFTPEYIGQRMASLRERNPWKGKTCIYVEKPPHGSRLVRIKDNTIMAGKGVLWFMGQLVDAGIYFARRRR